MHGGGYAAVTAALAYLTKIVREGMREMRAWRKFRVQVTKDLEVIKETGKCRWEDRGHCAYVAPPSGPNLYKPCLETDPKGA